MQFLKHQNLAINRIFLIIFTIGWSALGYINLASMAQYLTQHINQSNLAVLLFQKVISILVNHYLPICIGGILIVISILFVRSLIGRHNTADYFRYPELFLFLINMPMVIYWCLIDDIHVYLLFGVMVVLLVLNVFSTWKISRYGSNQ